MRLLYISHRYHTNQLPVMAGWNARGDEVYFLAQFEGIVEEHDYVHFYRMKPTAATLRRYAELDKKFPADEAESKKIRAFIPDLWDTLKKIKEIRPDVVILRDYAKTNAVVVLCCRLLRIRNLVMYVQTPLYGSAGNQSILQRIFRAACFPRACFTPVYYQSDCPSHTLPAWYPGAPRWFVPLVCEGKSNIPKEYCRDGKIRILDVGKYRDYKNHFFFVDAVAAMEHRDNIQVTIIGQLSNDAERAYYEKLLAYIEDKQLSDIIELRGNVPFFEMEEVYRRHDVLVLASKSETAGMVILEAMAMGLCVVSSVYCGLSSYLEEDNCGYTFDLDKPERISVILDRLAQSPEEISRLGRKSCQVVQEKYGFNSYRRSLNELLQAEYGFEIP